jgi:F-type H+-transporting ATPase subunit gamma
MELVAASKMRRATSAVTSTRPFSHLAWETVLAVGENLDSSLHPLLTPKRGSTKTLYVVFTSDRGLCGGYNAKILRECFKDMQSREEAFDVITVGKRAELAMKRAGIKTVASFVDVTNNPTFKEIRPVAQMAIDGFKNGEYAKVIMGYTDFKSALSQKPVLLTLLPLSRNKTELGETNSIGSDERHAVASEKLEYKFEPSPDLVLDAMLPRITETMVWQALLEASASEHSARMLAMRSASDAAAEMIDDLTLTFNQARQSGITQEIAEISSGAAALNSN